MKCDHILHIPAAVSLCGGKREPRTVRPYGAKHRERNISGITYENTKEVRTFYKFTMDARCQMIFLKRLSVFVSTVLRTDLCKATSLMLIQSVSVKVRRRHSIIDTIAKLIIYTSTAIYLIRPAFAHTSPQRNDFPSQTAGLAFFVVSSTKCCAP